MIVLVGFMGAGKTTVGSLLAERLGLPFKDTDEMIVRRTGTSIAEIFNRSGEAAFRELERGVVEEALSREDAVISLGGGALTDPQTVSDLEDETVVHLFVDYEEAVRRVGGDAGRPLMQGDPRSLYGRRLGTYEVIADDVVQTDDLTPDEVAEEIVHRLHLSDHIHAGAPPLRAVPAEPIGEESAEPLPELERERPEPSADRNGRADLSAADLGDIAVEDEPSPASIPEPERNEFQTTEPEPEVEEDHVATQITVAAPSRWYEVTVGSGLIDRAAQFVPAPEDAEKVFLVTHSRLLRMARIAASSFESMGLRPVVIEVPEGEQAKSLETAALAYDLMAAARASRHDLVLGVGGGVVTDLAGFLASTFNRGMAVAYVPTTLLGQVDAAIGGKTGINLPGAKNKVGTFHQPLAVICDAETLRSLPIRELTSGLAEVVKYGLIADHTLLRSILEDGGRMHGRDPKVLSDVVRRSVAVKAEIVAVDERDSGRRAVLNYGHTVGHAIESTDSYERYRHGEAISLGMMAAAYIAEELWDLPEGLAHAHRGALEAVGLPVQANLRASEILGALTQDKKYRRGLRFVLLREQGKPETDVSVPEELVRKAVERLAS